MGVRHPEQERLLRLETKSLDGELREVLTAGLACSPFEAEAVLDAVNQVYAPLWRQGGVLGRPGEISLVAVSADEPAGKPIAACEKRTISLQLHRGAEDDRLLEESGPRGFRRARLPELCQQALSQGALLTREDLAFRVYFVGLRTISRDLAWLRAHDDRPLPLRSTVPDIGPVLSHRVEVVELALAGKTTSEICRALRHSPEAVSNYLGTFVRCAQLEREGLDAGQIAFLLKRGRGLIERYLELVRGCGQQKVWSAQLRRMLELGRGGREKKELRGDIHGR
jgi:hypothetical protein